MTDQGKRAWIDVEHGDVQRTNPRVPSLPDGRYVHLSDVREALQHYGSHLQRCEVWIESYVVRQGHCTCGLDALLDGLAALDEES